MVLGQLSKSFMASGRGWGNCRTGGEVWQSSGSVAGCCSLDSCDWCLLVYVCLNSWASSCMVYCKKVVLARLIVVVYFFAVYILFLLRSQFLLLLRRDLVKVSIVFLL